MMVFGKQRRLEEDRKNAEQRSRAAQRQLPQPFDRKPCCETWATLILYLG
jgi:hypothetical protein